MTGRKRILIVDDNQVNRQILCKILSDRYDTIQAQNGKEALHILQQGNSRVDVILLDIIMPVMGGYEFLKTISQIPVISGIPIIVTTQQEGEEAEVKALSLGAYDFLTKPYRPAIIKQRVANLIKFRETASFMNVVQRDAMTGLYNKDAFFERAHQILGSNPEQRFAIITIDIERFKLVNDIFGVEEADKLLKFLADHINLHLGYDNICGRLGGDVFVVLARISAKKVFTSKDFVNLVSSIKEYPLNINLSLKHGVYYIKDVNLPINVMCDRAKLAAESIKGKYDLTFACYDESLRNTLLAEQQIVNDMKSALKSGQFEVYFQPKFDLDTETIAGAEALVRWKHPEKGFLSPAEFIPLFEKNGFITDLDMYVWDKTCDIFSRWKEQGIKVVPVSVNVSRVDIYNPNLVDILVKTIEKYGLTTAEIHLEITETAYTESPKQIIDTVKQLHDLGFIIEMDDFGTGYSSLNMLNELPLDILKLDMRFLQNHSNENRKGNILNFIVSLAKWLGLSVVAEGVETYDQVLFLRSMSCNLGQGYYFSKPIPPEDFKKFLTGKRVPKKIKSPIPIDVVKIEDIWNPLSPFNALFNCYIGALGIFEFSGENVLMIRANDRLFSVLGTTRERIYKNACNIVSYLSPDDREGFFADVDAAKGDFKEIDNYSCWCVSEDNSERWLHIKMKMIQNKDDKAIMLVAMEDITNQKKLENELISRQKELRGQREFFERIYDFAPCGMAQFDIEDNHLCTRVNKAMVRMMGFDSIQEFNEKPRYFWDFVVPECRESVKQKLPKMLKSEAGKYISIEFGMIAGNRKRSWVKCSMQKMKYEDKMFFQCAITDITSIKKVESELRESAQRDPLTGLLNRNAFEIRVHDLLSAKNGNMAAFVMLDIDNFKQVNDTKGHLAGDNMLKSVAEIIKGELRPDDSVARMGGDEFAAYIDGISTAQQALQCGKRISEKIRVKLNLCSSLGIAIYPIHGTAFNDLYGRADTMLYKAKAMGKNQILIYQD